MTERNDSGDDLAAWADDDLVRALRAPGTATELADQERYVAAFREARGSTVRSLPRRAAGRFGAGGTAVVVTVALTSGVAAAFTGHLPDPVQQVAHSVIGAPAPDTGGRHHASGPRRQGAHHSTGSSGPSTDPSASTSPQAPSSPTTSGDDDHPGTTQSHAPSDPPSSGTTSPPTTSSGGAASAMTMSAPSHRVALGQTLTLSGLVTDDTGTPLAGHTVVLQVRGPRHWRPVVETATDTAGVASATTPAVTRTARFRWHADRGVSSSRWLVRMIPVLSLSADVGGSRTTLTLTSQGTRAGDRFQVFRHLAGRTTPVRRGRVDPSGSAVVSVLTPRHRATYAVRLLRTRLHAAARARVPVVPPAPAGLTVSGSASRVTPGGSVTIAGTVSSASGDPLPGHRVALLRRGPAHWRLVRRTVTDAAGHVSFATPAITATSRFRLRTDHRVVSDVWRVVEVPSLTASVDRSATVVTVSAHAQGARPGDRVFLLRRTNGRLVRVRHARLGADGSVSFAVKPRATRTTYVVKVSPTKRHGSASTSLTVAAG